MSTKRTELMKLDAVFLSKFHYQGAIPEVPGSVNFGKNVNLNSINFLIKMNRKTPMFAWIEGQI